MLIILQVIGFVLMIFVMAAFYWVALVIGFVFLLVMAPVYLWQAPKLRAEQEAREQEFVSYMRAHDGLVIFLYTSRKRSQRWIERNVIDDLPEGIEVVLLEGKRIRSGLPTERVAQVLDRLCWVAFPKLAMFVDGELRCRSLNQLTYKTIQDGRGPEAILAEIEDSMEIMWPRLS